MLQNITINSTQSVKPGELTHLLYCWRSGEPNALNELIEIVYHKLSQQAHRMMQYEQRNQTLQTQGLVHEAYFRLRELEELNWRDRNHFFSVWKGIMRRVLIDRARTNKAHKRGGRDALRITFNDRNFSTSSHPDIDDLCDALDKLEKIDDCQRQVVELRHFAGFTIEEVAIILELSPATVKRKWTLARAWLYRELSSYPC